MNNVLNWLQNISSVEINMNKTVWREPIGYSLAMLKCCHATTQPSNAIDWLLVLLFYLCFCFVVMEINLRDGYDGYYMKRKMASAHCDQESGRIRGNMVFGTDNSQFIYANLFRKMLNIYIVLFINYYASG